MSLTNALLGSAIEDNLILKDRFAIPGTINDIITAQFRNPNQQQLVLVDLTGVVHDNYLLSGLLYASGRSQGMARIQ